MNIIESDLKNSINENIHYWKYESEKEKDIIVVSHGVGEHGGRYEWFAEYFTDKGYTIYCNDHKGHGKSYGKRGHVDGFDEYVNDLNLLIEYVKKEHKKERIHLIGHSLGGVIATCYADKYQKNLLSLVLSSPGFAPFKNPFVIKDILGRLLSNLVPDFTMSNDLQLEFLSRDKVVIDAYKEDPLVHDQVSTRFYTSYLEAVDLCFKNANLLNVPVMIMVAAKDKIVNPEIEREFYRHLTFEPKELIEFPESFHELFNDTNRVEVYDRLNAWLLKMKNYY